jgi:hypothetical protein
MVERMHGIISVAPPHGRAAAARVREHVQVSNFGQKLGLNLASVGVSVEYRPSGLSQGLERRRRRLEVV